MSLPLRRVETTAVLDTGSTGTLVRGDLVEALGLSVSGFTLLVPPTSESVVVCETTIAELALVGENGRTWTMRMNLCVLPRRTGPGVLLGMDCFQEGLVEIHFAERYWGYSFPA